MARELTAIWHPHPVTPLAGREVLTVEAVEGRTVRELLLAQGFDPHREIVVVLDDRLLTVAEWDTICPRPGQIVNVQAVASGGGGGGGGSNPVAAVLSIALVVAAPYLAASIGTLGGFALTTAAGGLTLAGSMVAGAIMMAGNMLIGAMFAPHAPSMSTPSGAYDQPSPTYSLTGGSNRMRPYEAMPLVMGTHRLFPDLAARPYAEFGGEDQFLYQIFHLGLCPASLSEWKIGTTPIEDFQGVEWFWPNAFGPITAFPGNVDTVSGAELSKAGGWVTRQSSAQAYRLGIDLEGVLYYANDSGGLAETAVELEIEYRRVGATTWLPGGDVVRTYTADGFWSFGEYFTYTRYQHNADGSWTIWYIGSGAPWEQYFYAENTDPAAGYDTTSNHWEWQGDHAYFGRWRYIRFDDWAGSPAPQRPYVDTHGTTTTLRGSSQKPQRVALTIDVPESSGPYEVRIRRTTDDSTAARRQDKVTWSALKTYQADTANYAGQYRAGLKIQASAQLNGVVQQLSVMANAECEFWDGTAWVSGHTSNPAHWFGHFARGRRATPIGDGRLLYGCGLADAQIDLAALHAWAVFCANERLSFNAIIDGGQTAADVLNMIARCGFASPSWASGKLGVVWDARNQAPVAAFGMSNILRGTFEVSYVTEQLADEVIVSFINPDKDWQQDQVRVVVPGATNPQRPSTVELMGCTDAAMAGKFANYLAAQQKYRRRRISWESDFEGFVCQRGDVVLLSHDLTQWGCSGRLVAVNGATVTLDRAVPRNGTTEYLMVKRPDGTLTTYAVAAGSGDQDTLTAAAALSLQDGALPVDHIWFFSPLATPGKKVKIVSVSPVSDARVKIEATDEDPAFYAAWDGVWSAAQVSTLLVAAAPELSRLAVTEHLVKTTVGAQAEVTATWRASGGVDHVRLRWSLDGGPWSTLTSYGESASFIVSAAGMLAVEATPVALTSVGTRVSLSARIYGLTLPPADVAWFYAEGRNLSWGDVPDLDLAGYRLRWIPGASSDWGQAQPLHDGLVTASPWTMPAIPVGTATLLIKAVDTSGNESNAPAMVVVDLGDPLIANIITTRALKAGGFPGQIGGGAVSGGNLLAASTNSIWNPNDAALMWSADAASPMWDLTYYQALTYRTTITVAAGEVGSQMTIASTIAGDAWRLEYRRPVGDAAPMWGAADTPMWSDDAAPMRGNAPGYVPWPGAITAEAGDYEIRVRTAFGRSRGSITALAVNFDVPDITEYLHDVAIAAGGTRLAPTKSYHSIRAVHLTLQDDGGTARTARVMDKSLAGPLIKAFDSSNAATTGHVDAIIQGY